MSEIDRYKYGECLSKVHYRESGSRHPGHEYRGRAVIEDEDTQRIYTIIICDNCGKFTSGCSTFDADAKYMLRDGYSQRILIKNGRGPA